MKVAIAGAGAMGSRFGYQFYKSGYDVILIDNWKEHVETINANGLRGTVDGEAVFAEIPAYFPSQVKEPVDVVFLFTKAMQLSEMLESIQPIMTEDTKVVCLLNGLGHEEIVEKYVPRANIFMGITLWTAGLGGPGLVKLIGNGNVELQNLDPAGKDQALEIVVALQNAGLNGVYSENVKYSIWRKACVNGVDNALATILDVNLAQLGSTSVAKELTRTIVNEFADVAEAEGTVLDRDEVVEHVESTFDPETIGSHYPSMHQDLIQNHRPTEIDFINGAVVRKAEKHHFSTPYCKLITQLIHAKEELLCGEIQAVK